MKNLQCFSGVVSKIVSLLTSFLIFLCCQVKAQKNDETLNSVYTKLNQAAPTSQNPGSYSQVINASSTKLFPGDSFNIEHFITGYGQVDYRSVKLYYSFSAQIIDTINSKVTHSFKLSKDKSEFSWGGIEQTMYNSGYFILRGAITLKDTITGRAINQSYYDDFRSKDDIEKDRSFMAINTEVVIRGEDNKRSVPVKFNAKLKDDVKPGDYLATFTLTYFNGREWTSDRVQTEIKVLNVFERNEVIIQWTAIFVAVMTIFSLVKPVLEFLKWVFSKKFWKPLKKIRKFMKLKN
nr:hypothetical protein [Allomuricauda sp.]